VPQGRGELRPQPVGRARTSRRGNRNPSTQLVPVAVH
jgi:hypothetical protein